MVKEGLEPDKSLANIFTVFHLFLLINTLRILEEAAKCSEMRLFVAYFATFLQLFAFGFLNEGAFINSFLQLVHSLV